jgi:tetratricopeptide (TPR) repeat protein
VFHCDLKPANILLRDGRATDPVVTDFGLARLVGEVTKLTLTGQILGTPAYMAPEQAFGTRQPLSPGPDVYGLGAILYEMLTGRPPFQGPTPLEIVLQKQNCEPTRPRVLTSRVPRDLETVCLKCLEKDPRRRYASADALADDLARWLRGESVRARRVGPLGNGLRWCRRKPIIAGLLGLLILSVTVGFSASLLLLRRAMAGEARAVENERREETARRDAEANAQEARQILGDLIHFSPKESSELGTPVPTKPDTEPLVRAESHCARLLREKPGDTDLRVTLTKVRGALGEIYCERGQIKEAEACFREARELWEELVVTDARSVECRARLAVTILWQAQAAAAAKEYARAFALKQSALALWQQLVVENPEDAGHLVNEEACRRQLILTAHSIWAVRQPLLHPLEKDVASLSEVVRAQPGDAALRHRLALTYVLLAEVLHGEGEADRAFVCWQHAHQQYRELVAARSNDLPARLALAHCCSRLMRAQISDPYYMEAVALFETTCPRVAALLQEQPNQDLPRSFLVEDYCSLAMCHAKAGAAALAADTCRKMMGNHSKAATDRSADPLASVDSMAQLSECLRAAGQIAPARAMAHDAVSLSARYDAFSSQDPGFSRRLAENSLRLSALLRHIGDPAESLHQAEMGLHRFQDLAQRTPALPVYSDVSNAWVAIAKARWDLGQPEEAVAAHWETVAAERRVFDLAPDERDNRARLSKCYGRLIDCGRHRARPAAIAKALLEQEKLWADNAEQLLKVSDNFRGLAGEVGHGKDRLSPEEQTERQGYLDQSERIKRAAEAVRRRADGPKSVASGTR